jgi:hypothetical protein
MAYATIAEVKAYLGIDGSADDALLTALLPRAQKWLEDEIGAVFEASADSTRYFDAVADVDGRRLWLDTFLYSITSITNGDGVVVTAGQYVTEPRNAAPYHAITLRSNSGVSWTYDDDPENAIAIAGRWAYSASAPADIVHATVRLCGFLYRQKDSQVFDVTSSPEMGTITIPRGTPADVWAIIRLYRNRLRRIPR